MSLNLTVACNLAAEVLRSAGIDGVTSEALGRANSIQLGMLRDRFALHLAGAPLPEHRSAVLAALRAIGEVWAFCNLPKEV